MRYLLKIIFLIDAILTVGFGVYSHLFPYETFGSIITIPDEPVVLVILSSLSIFYVLTGLMCFIGSQSKRPINLWIAGLMVVRHAWLGIFKFMDIGSSWLVGSPYPDIIIHESFVFAYALGIYFILKDKQKTTS